MGKGELAHPALQAPTTTITSTPTRSTTRLDGSGVGAASSSALCRWCTIRISTTTCWDAGALSLVQMGARPYSPLLGRFLSVDPVEGGSANDYEYTAANPVNLTDLDGRAIWVPIILACIRFCAPAARAVQAARTVKYSGVLMRKPVIGVQSRLFGNKTIQGGRMGLLNHKKMPVRVGWNVVATQPLLGFRGAIAAFRIVVGRGRNAWHKDLFYGRVSIRGRWLE